MPANRVEDCGDFGVFSYRRPTGHTKTARRHYGDTPWVEEWSVVVRVGDVWAVGWSRAGFASREDAIAAGPRVAVELRARLSAAQRLSGEV